MNADSQGERGLQANIRLEGTFNGGLKITGSQI